MKVLVEEFGGIIVTIILFAGVITALYEILSRASSGVL